MNRREALAGIGSVAVLGAGGLYAFSSGEDDEAVDPVAVERLEGSGEVAGTMRVPERGRPTVLSVFATWCSVCRRTMPEIVEVHRERPGADFVSVTNEAVGQTTTREDVADWWHTHGGDWPVGVDTDLELSATFDVRSVPHTIVFDDENRIVYDERGEKTAEELYDALDRA